MNTKNTLTEREIFEKWADDQGWPRDTAFRRQGFVIWQAARQPLLEDVRVAVDVLEDIKLATYALTGDHAIHIMVTEALAKLPHGEKDEK